MKAVTTLLKNKSVVQLRCLYKRPLNPSPSSQLFNGPKINVQKQKENTSKKAPSKSKLMKRDRAEPIDATKAIPDMLNDCNKSLETLQQTVDLVSTFSKLIA